VLLVWLYMSFTLQSIILASIGVTQIFLSFPISIFLYRVVFGYETMSVMAVVSLWVVTGVGADDIFVLTETWRHTQWVEDGNGRQIEASSQTRMGWVSGLQVQSVQTV
jgi:hypothetical protein